MSIFTARTEWHTCPPDTLDDWADPARDLSMFVEEVNYGDPDQRDRLRQLFKDDPEVVPMVGTEACRAVIVYKDMQGDYPAKDRDDPQVLAGVLYNINGSGVQILKGVFSGVEPLYSNLKIVDYLMDRRAEELGLPFSSSEECALARRLGHESISAFPELDSSYYGNVAAAVRPISEPVRTARITSCVVAGQIGVLGGEIQVA